MNPELEQLKAQVAELSRRLDALNSYTTIPYEVDSAFRERFADIAGLTVSSKNASSEDQSVVSAVDFGAQTTTTTPVLDEPDTFLAVSLSGIPYYIPAYTS